MRSVLAIAAMVVLATTVLLGTEGLSSTAHPDGTPSAHDPPRVTIAVLPQHTGPSRLARVDDMAVGLLSAGIGSVAPAQTFIDIGQGARLNGSLYDQPPPLLSVDAGAGGAPARVPPAIWQRVRERAEAAPADLVPGLLGTTLTREGVATHADPLAGTAAAILADERGAILEQRDCRACPRVAVLAASLGQLRALARRLRGGDLLIAIERPPPPRNRELTIGVAGPGFHGTLTSDSTRMRGYVLSTDVAPTILDHLGLSVPDEMSGQPIRAEGDSDPDYLQSLSDRLAVIGPRRGPVIGTNLLIWVALAAIAGIAFGPRGLRGALPVLAVTVAYLPAVLLLTAALEPSEPAERLIAGVGSPALALLTLRLVGGYGALAVAGTLSVLGYAADVIAGSGLTELSLIGPNPALGVRFYGIGNELEATVGALVPIATGAALVAWAPRVSARQAALAFALTALLAVAAFAPGRFGADVGAAIGIPIGAAVAIAAGPGATAPGYRWRSWLVVVIAAPLAALAALVVADLLLGGNAHLTRSVLRAGGLHDFGNVAERRLRLSAGSFGRYADTPMLWIAALAIVAGLAQWRRIKSWFGERRMAWAGLLGAGAATAAGTLANDSGALLLMIGTALAAATAGLAWATHAVPQGRATGRQPPASPVT